MLAFYGLNGYRLTVTNDESYEFVMEIAAGDVDEVAAIADRLAAAAAAADWRDS